MKIFHTKAIITALLVISFTSPAFSKNADYYYYNANASLTSGNLNDAVILYKKAINENEKFSEAFIGLSIAYREIGDYDKAYQSLKKALIIKPDYFQAYYNLGLILEKQKKCNEAIKAYEKFLKEVPGANRFSDAKQRIIKLKECG